MALIVAFVIGLLAGGAVVAAVSGRVSGVRAAAVRAEAALLRQRVVDLEAAGSQERELIGVLAPLGASLSRLEQQVHTLERDRLDQFARLDAQVGAVAASSDALRTETASLAGALRSSSVRGAWGEVQLRRVVEHAGLVERVDFDTQVSGVGPDGSGVRPDVVVRLPGGKQLVVDAKAPMTAYLEASADDVAPERRQELLRAHARALRGHVDALAGREYWRAFSPSPEMVVCFVPGESMLAAALAADPTLHEHALGRGVVLTAPGGLVALLRTVAFTWQQEALAGNARELYDVGRELYARLGTLGGHAAKLGRTLHRAVEDYNGLVGALEQRVLVSARKLSQLGLSNEPLPGMEPLESTPRPLTAAELLDDLGRRPEIVDEMLPLAGVPDRVSGANQRGANQRDGAQRDGGQRDGGQRTAG